MARARETERPGVVLYFDIRPALNRLTREQCGDLLLAVLNYAEFGEKPELDDLVGMAFDLIAPRIDRDAAKYAEKQQKSRYAVYCRKAQADGQQCLEFEDWLAAEARTRPPPAFNRQRAVSDDNG